MKYQFLKFALLLSLVTSTSAWSQSAELTVARVYAAPALNGPTLRGLKMSPDGTLITYLRPNVNDQTTLDLWARSVKGGEPKLLVAGSELEPKGTILTEVEKSRRDRQRIAYHGVTDYMWDGVGAKILVPGSGNLFLFDVRSGKLERLSRLLGEISDPKISPKGSYVTYVREMNLHAFDLATGRDRAITTEAGDNVSFGTAEFIAQEEMSRYTGYWTSPDDQRIAFTRVDETAVDEVPRFDLNANGGTIVSQRYPRAGRPNATVQLYIANLDGDQRTRVDLGDDSSSYLARVDWSCDGKTLYVQRESRDETKVDLLAVDPHSGFSKVLMSEIQHPWIDLNGDMTPLENGDFIWGSDRTGFHHLYLYNRDGTLKHPITQGDWLMSTNGAPGLHPSSIYGVDQKKGQVYFLASMQTPLTRDLFAVSYELPDSPKRITGGDGWWNTIVSKNDEVFLGTYSDPKTPAQTALYSIYGKRLFWIEENALKAGHPYFQYLDHKTYPEFGTLKAEDGQTLYYSITKPYGFDPNKRYPVIVDVYGGPGGLPMVGKRWGSGADQLLTQAGFVLFRLDNRGTPERGVKFASPIHLALGGPEVRDQIVGQRFLATLPFVDAKRIGVMGWSYGGYMTIRLLTEPGSGFAAGIAGGPPSDWRLYDSHYTERFMGDPKENATYYDRSAILPRLPQLAKPGAPRLLLIHGMADDNVAFENSTRIMATLQSQGTAFDLMLYPGERHVILEPAKQMQLFDTMLEFFKRNLGGPQ